MPSLSIPESGLSFEGPGPDSWKSGTQSAIGLTLTNGMIENMIKCVQNGTPIQLSLGQNPHLSFGNSTQPLSRFEDPFTQEIYQSEFHQGQESDDEMAFYNKDSLKKPRPFTGEVHRKSTPSSTHWLANINARFKPANRSSSKPTTTTTTTTSVSKSTEDAALSTLRNSMNLAEAKKNENVTKLIEPIQGKKSGKKFLSVNGGRSISGSPSHFGTQSPSLAPTSIPASEQQAMAARAARKPVVHLLAVEPLSEDQLQDMLPDTSLEDLRQLLNKVADKESSNKYALRRKFFEELDVWSYDYKTSQDRQLAIDNAIKVFDKQRLSTSEPAWERLKPKSERDNGVSLSRIQANLAQGAIARTPKPQPKSDSGRNSPTEETSSQKDNMARQSQANKKKTEAQAKRLTGQTKKAASKPTSKPAAKKEKPKSGKEALSNEYIQDSDEEDEKPAPKPAVSKPKPKPKQAPPPAPAPAPAKRGREEESSSDSSQPLMKKMRKDVPISTPRLSEASQSSRTSSTKAKTTSPQKSSPLASSPPTNASEFGDSSSGSSTPARPSLKSSRSPIHKRHQKSSSVTSSASASSVNSIYPNMTPQILRLAQTYRDLYPEYVKQYKEISNLNKRDPVKEEKLLALHERLEGYKARVKAAMTDL